MLLVSICLRTGGVMLYNRFMDTVFEHVKSLNKKALVWEDVANNGVHIPSDVVIQTWQCWSDVRIQSRISVVFPHLPLFHPVLAIIELGPDVLTS
jgi:hypothetical protein